MKHLKTFESYYDDLTPFTYGRKGNNKVNIGWLEIGKEYPKGEVDPMIIKTLSTLSPSERYKGYHGCDFCRENGVRYVEGSSVNYEISGNGKIYCFPGLLKHYIEKHEYKPPQEFLDAVMSSAKSFESGPIRNPYIAKSSYKKPEYLGDIKEPVEIRIDVEAVSHALDRQFRHGFSSGDNNKIGASISKDEILDTIETSVEQITISLMQNEFNITQEEDNYPTKGVKAGEPNRFVIRNKKTDLNIVAQLEPGENEFKLTVITVMRKPDFKSYGGQYVVEV